MANYSTILMVTDCQLCDLQVGETCLVMTYGIMEAPKWERFTVVQLTNDNEVKLESYKRVITRTLNTTVMMPENIHGYGICDLEFRDVLNKRIKVRDSIQVNRTVND